MEVGAIGIALGFLSLYHVILYLGVITGQAPNAQLSMNIYYVTSWVSKHKTQGDALNVTLAIHTLRNTMYVAIFLGGSALTYAFDLTNSYNDIVEDRMKVRTVIISALLFCSFLCWACVIRYASHCGYTIGTLSYDADYPAHRAPTQAAKKRKQAAPAASSSSTASAEAAPGTAAAQRDEAEPGPPNALGTTGALKTAEDDDNQLPNNHTSHKTRVGSRHRSVEEECLFKSQLIMVFFSLGFRFMFIALPFAFLSVGAVALVISTGVLLIFLYFYDY